MSHKIAIKMINFQKSYSVPFYPFCPLRSTLVLFGPRWSYWVPSYFIHFSPIWSTLIIFSPSSPLLFYLVKIDHIWSILSTSVKFNWHWSFSVHMSTLVLIRPFVLIWSILVLYGPPCSHSVLLCPFAPFRLFVSTSVHFYALTYKKKKCLGWEYLFLIQIYIYIYIYIDLKLIISKIFNIKFIVTTFLLHSSLLQFG